MHRKVPKFLLFITGRNAFNDQTSLLEPSLCKRTLLSLYLYSLLKEEKRGLQETLEVINLSTRTDVGALVAFWGQRSELKFPKNSKEICSFASLKTAFIFHGVKVAQFQVEFEEFMAFLSRKRVGLFTCDWTP